MLSVISVDISRFVFALRASSSAVFALKQSGWDLVHFLLVDVMSFHEVGIRPY